MVLEQDPCPQTLRPFRLRQVPCRLFRVLHHRVRRIRGMPWSTCLWYIELARHASLGDSWNKMNISLNTSSISKPTTAARSNMAHQVPSIFHDSINAEYHLLALPRTICQHWSCFDFVQPGLRQDARTILMRHPRLDICVGRMLYKGFVVNGK